VSTVTILITHDENSLFASLHKDMDAAIEELRQYLNSNPVSYQEQLPDSATREQIEAAAIDRSQFAWDIIDEVGLPGGVVP
jgi:hypothetical protein